MIRRISWHWLDMQPSRLLVVTVSYDSMGFGRSGDGERYVFAAEDVPLIVDSLKDALESQPKEASK